MNNNSSDINYITTLIIEDIESYFNKREDNNNYAYRLNKYMNFEMEGIQMNIYIHRKKNNKYYYDLSAKNFKYMNEEIDLFTSSHFDTILDLFENLTYVKMNYTFYEKMLCSPKQKEKLQKLKKSLSFFTTENECSICYVLTEQQTICNHPICLHCREKCILLQIYNCPICRNPNLKVYPRDLLFTL
jgi:hypothetical protein